MQQPIFQLLSEIKWNPKLKKGQFTIYYYDRIQDKLLAVEFNEIKEFGKTFMAIEKDNKEVEIPLHRIREVKKGNKLIWKRGS